MKIMKPDQIERVEESGALFSAPVFQQPLVKGAESDEIDAAIVYFPKGVVNKWHTHEADQILIVTGGRGICATKDEEVEVTVGDVIYFPAGEVHWHGATPDSDFTHIAIKHPSGTTRIVED